MAKTIIEYVLAMDKAGKNRLLMHRLQALLDIMNSMDDIFWPKIIKAVCKMDEEEAPDADF